MVVSIFISSKVGGARRRRRRPLTASGRSNLPLVCAVEYATEFHKRFLLHYSAMSSVDILDDAACCSATHHQ